MLRKSTVSLIFEYFNADFRIYILLLENASRLLRDLQIKEKIAFQKLGDNFFRAKVCPPYPAPSTAVPFTPCKH